MRRIQICCSATVLNSERDIFCCCKNWPFVVIKIPFVALTVKTVNRPVMLKIKRFRYFWPNVSQIRPSSTVIPFWSNSVSLSVRRPSPNFSLPESSDSVISPTHSCGTPFTYVAYHHFMLLVSDVFFLSKIVRLLTNFPAYSRPIITFLNFVNFIPCTPFVM